MKILRKDKCHWITKNGSSGTLKAKCKHFTNLWDLRVYFDPKLEIEDAELEAKSTMSTEEMFKFVRDQIAGESDSKSN